MGACSDPTLDPGPITLLDENVGLDTLQPPVFAPLAQEFSDSLPGFYSTLDASFAALAAEQSIDLGDSILGAAADLTSNSKAAVNPEALANLQAAEAGFSVARNQNAALAGNLPPDVQSPTHVSVVVFRVTDAAGVPVIGALIVTDQDTGRGTTFVTDGTGAALVEIVQQSTISYTVTAPGFTPASGVTTGVIGFSIVRVTLQA